VFHSTAELDAQIEKLFAQVHTNFATQSQQSIKIMSDMLAIPEFRAGILLSSICFGLILYLAYSATAGAFAGYLRSRAPITLILDHPHLRRTQTDTIRCYHEGQTMSDLTSSAAATPSASQPH